MPSSRVAYKSSIVNKNQGGGNKKIGLYPSETTPASVYLARKSQKNSVQFLMKMKTTSLPITPIVPTDRTISLVITGADATTAYIFAENTDVGIADGAQNPNFTLVIGDILKIKNENSGHSLFITNGNGNIAAEAQDGESDKRVTVGVTGPGANNGDTITWDTKDAPAGTYHYQCNTHNNMYGTITLNAS